MDGYLFEINHMIPTSYNSALISVTMSKSELSYEMPIVDII